MLTDIDTSNVTELREAWRYEDTTEGGGVYFNPVMMDDRVIGQMPSNKLVALDAVTGKLLWEFAPDSSAIPNWSKGMTYHPGHPDRIFLISGGTLYSINAENGTVMKDFGNNGRRRSFPAAAFSRQNGCTDSEPNTMAAMSAKAL